MHISFFRVVLISLVIILSSLTSVSACSLAIHDWKLIAYFKIPLQVPIFPLSEISEISDQVIESNVSKVLWVSNHNILSRVGLLFLKLMKLPVAQIPWQAVNTSKSVLSIARKTISAENPSIIVGSDNVILKVALFSDRNSDYNCHQLVLMEESRIRAVIASSVSPWARESKGKTWLSLIFYKFPFLDNIISFSAFPYKKIRKSIYDDHGYVESLLAEKQLQRRTDVELDPLSDDFPQLPE